MLRFLGFITATLLGTLACFATTNRLASGASPIERQAARFVSLALSLGRQHPEEVDAYFGPPGLDVRHAALDANLDRLVRELKTLRTDLEAPAEVAASSRHLRLQAQVRAFNGLLDIFNRPGTQTFDAETRLVYGMEPPLQGYPKSSRALQTLDSLLPGPDSLASRVARFRDQFVVAPERRKAVFERALSECRARTLAKWRLPAGERLDVEWTRKVDAAWHRYHGHGRSTLQLNPAAVAYVGTAVDVACHEGYPGHHAQFVVMEASAGAGGLPVEDTVVLLRSPISMVREGAANYGVDLAFAPGERLAFERDVLFPLAGLDPARARQYRDVQRLVEELSSNIAPIARDYRDRRLSLELARRALDSSALVSSPDPLLQFVDRLGPYVLGYAFARDKVRSYIDTEHRQSGEDRWRILRTVLEQRNVTLLSQ